MSLAVVWFKRDLRLTDHAPLHAALSKPTPIILLYVFEPTILAQPDFSDRHGQFITQSIRDIQGNLGQLNLRMTVLMGEMEKVLDSIYLHYGSFSLFSYEETGTDATWLRDRQVAGWCQSHHLDWKEFPTNGVVRKLKSKSEWASVQRQRLSIPECQPNWKNARLLDATALEAQFPADSLDFGEQLSMQIGGEREAHQTLSSFLASRHHGYRFNLSKPEGARHHGSRLSPYLAWGNLSLKQVFNALSNPGIEKRKTRDLASFRSRLYWHDHFCQKLETMQAYERQSVNLGMEKGFLPWDQFKHDAWALGKTGYPLIDACMRCLNETGFLNFRMRAMLVAFHSYHLRLHWKPAALHLARMFLDYDPGIHYPQMQMQAGTCGYHTFRIYNPTLQARLHDPNGDFIGRWVPELAVLPPSYRLEPWKMTPLEQVMYQFIPGKNYPLPIIEIEKTGQEARQLWWALANKPEVKAITKRLLSRINRPPKGFDQDEKYDE